MNYLLKKTDDSLKHEYLEIKKKWQKKLGPLYTLVVPLSFVLILKLRFKARWNEKFGYKYIIIFAFPLILSTGSWSIQHFVDRMFLAWYSPESIAASLPSGILNFAFISIFLGTASYAGTFIAQYFGSKQFDKIGSILWQSLYLSIIAGVFFLFLIPAAPEIFNFVGHDKEVKELEIIYFQILCLGAFPQVAASSIGGFFSSINKTVTVMWVNIIMTAINIILDYLLIFNKLNMGVEGIEGAAIATVVSVVCALIMYGVILLLPEYKRKFNTIKSWKFNREKFIRLLKFGFPNGVQFFLDMAGFTFFILFVGKYGKESLAATSIAFNISTLAFMPMIGFGITISVLVGQNLGRNNSSVAERITYSGFHLTFGYMFLISLAYLFKAEWFIMPFSAFADDGSFANIAEITTVLLKFVALYSIFEAMSIIFASAIKGAGDTFFVMVTMIVASTGILIVPSYLSIFIFNWSLYVSWIFTALYVIVIGFIFLIRFRRSKWKIMRVIESEPVS